MARLSGVGHFTVTYVAYLNKGMGMAKILKRSIIWSGKLAIVIALVLLMKSLIISNVNAADQPGPVSVKSKIPDAWQIRRAQFVKTLQQANAGDPNALATLDAILTEFERKPLERTPLENLDIIGAYYLKKDSVDKALPVIVMNQVLGWYDALRFGTDSGRVEIAQNQIFFKRPFAISGKVSIDQIKSLVHDHPEDVAAKVNEGIAFAMKNKNNPGYDVHWPAAYGLERLICKEGGACVAPNSLPEDQWNAAWKAATQRVLVYYRVSSTN
jgi:hypothetical protein